MDFEGLGNVEFQENRTTLLWYGDAPTVETGFGRVTRSITLGLWKTGRYNIVCVGINDRGEDHPLKKLPNYHVVSVPYLDKDPYGYQVMPKAIENYRPEVLIALNDPWLLTSERGRPDYNWFEKVIQEKAGNIPWMVYFPVDGGPFKQDWCNLFRSSWRAIAYSNYGKKVVLDAAPDLKDKLKMIYHGVDLSTFQVLPNQVKEKVRQEMNIPEDHKFIGIIARNQPRKNIPRGLRIFKYFRDGYGKCKVCGGLTGVDQFDSDCELCGSRDWAVAREGFHKASLYLHMNLKDPRGNDLPKIIADEKVRGVVYPKQHDIARGVPDSVLSAYYNALDVMFLPTTGEGFGLPVLESLASGTPVVATRTTSVVELLEDGGGILVDGSDWTIVDDTAQVRRHVIDIEKAVSALWRICSDDAFYEEQVSFGQLFASGMGWDNAILKFDDEIQSVLKERVSIIDSFPVKAEPKVFCVRPYGSAGDILCTTPVIAEIKKKYSGCSITYALPEAYVELVDGNPYIDAAVPYEKRWEGTRNREISGKLNVGKFDFFGIEDQVEGVMRPNVPFSRQEIWANNCGVDLGNYLPIYKIKDSERAWAEEHFGGLLREINVAIKIDTEEPYLRIPVDVLGKVCKFVMNDKVAVFAFIQNRNYLNFDEVIEVLPEGVHVVVVDDEETPYRKMIAALNLMDIVVSGDGSFCHFAGMLGKAIVPVFGPSDFSQRLKHYNNIYPVASTGCPYAPCWRNQSQIPCRVTGAFFTSKCLDDMKAKDIFTQVMKAIKGVPQSVTKAKADVEKKKATRDKRKARRGGRRR
jgi:glycosyltransferase involved in cell wall biosynthesis/ADP-heptose:LPS heptosyltransferase